MTAQTLLRSVALGAIALGLGMLVLRPLIVQTDSPAGTAAVNPAAHARDPIALIASDKRTAMPDFGYSDALGKTHRLRDDVGDRPILIHFWATWCGPCLPELPGLEALSAREATRLRLLPISLDQHTIATVGKFFADRHLESLPILAPSSDLPIPSALPTSILLDKQGRVAWTTAGAHPWDGADVGAALAILNQP